MEDTHTTAHAVRRLALNVAFGFENFPRPVYAFVAGRPGTRRLSQSDTRLTRHLGE